MRWLAFAAAIALLAVLLPAGQAAPAPAPASPAPSCDLVWATDPLTGESGPHEVLDLIVGEGVKQLVVVTIGGHDVVATDGHPFWVEGIDRWVDAGDLQAGHQVLSSGGLVLTIDSVASYEAVERVHNLHVEGLHTYYVQFGDDSVLVHNTSVCPIDFASAAKRADHVGRHGPEWTPALDDAAYMQGARNLLSSKPGGSILGHTRSNGDILRYNIDTNEFAAMKSDGTIKTYLRPKWEIHYWLSDSGVRG